MTDSIAKWADVSSDKRMVMGRCYRASGNPVFNKPVDESRSEKEEGGQR